MLSRLCAKAVPYVNLPTWRLSGLFWIECNPKIHLSKLLRHLMEELLIMPAM